MSRQPNRFVANQLVKKVILSVDMMLGILSMPRSLGGREHVLSLELSQVKFNGIFSDRPTAGIGQTAQANTRHALWIITLSSLELLCEKIHCARVDRAYPTLRVRRTETRLECMGMSKKKH